MESYKNNCSLSSSSDCHKEPLHSKTNHITNQLCFISWSICVKIFNDFLPSINSILLTHTPAAENAFTPATQNAINQDS